MTKPGPSRELLAKVAEGDPQALTKIYELYEEMVYRTALKVLANREDAKDIMHDVFLGLPQAARKYEWRGSFDGWLRRVTYRLALMEIRSRKTRKEVALDNVPPEAASGQAETVVERVAINDALQTLSEEQRLVYVLKEKEGYTHAEIAQQLSITKVAARSRLMRAMRQLREILGDDR